MTAILGAQKSRRENSRSGQRDRKRGAATADQRQRAGSEEDDHDSDSANSRPTNDVIFQIARLMTAVELRDRLRGNPVGAVPKITGEPEKAGNRHPGSWRATYLPFAGGADRSRDGDRWREMPGGRTREPHFQERSGGAALIVI